MSQIQPVWLDRSLVPFTTGQIFSFQDATDLTENNGLLWYAFQWRHVTGGTALDGEHQDALIPFMCGTVLYSGTFGSGGVWTLEDGVGPSLVVANHAPDTVGLGQVQFNFTGNANLSAIALFLSPGAVSETGVANDYGNTIWHVDTTGWLAPPPPFGFGFQALSCPTDAAIAWAAASNGCRFSFSASADYAF